MNIKTSITRATTLATLRQKMYRGVKSRFVLSLLAVGCCNAAVTAEVEADPVAVMSAKGPAITLTRAELADVFLKKRHTLPNGQAVIPLDLLPSATRDQFYKEVVGKDSALMAAYWSKLVFTGEGQPPKEVSGIAALKKILVNNPGTIAYVDSKDVDVDLRVVSSSP